jgi:hypothetical protein
VGRGDGNAEVLERPAAVLRIGVAVTVLLVFPVAAVLLVSGVLIRLMVVMRMVSGQSCMRMSSTVIVVVLVVEVVKDGSHENARDKRHGAEDACPALAKPRRDCAGCFHGLAIEAVATRRPAGASSLLRTAGRIQSSRYDWAPASTIRREYQVGSVRNRRSPLRSGLRRGSGREAGARRARSLRVSA